MEVYLGTILMVGFNFAPQGWALCNGQLLSIAQNTALFSLLGTTYGGNGTTNFALPDLQGRVPIHMGNGAGLSPYVIGQNGGTENVTLQVGQLPAHTHPFAPLCSTGTANEKTAVGHYSAPAAADIYASSSNAAMGAGMTGITGGGQPVPVIQPYLTVNFIIALQGLFPPRS